VVIVPAIGGNVLDWLAFHRELARDLRVCVYDRAGFTAEVTRIIERLRTGESPVAIARETGAISEPGPLQAGTERPASAGGTAASPAGVGHSSPSAPGE